MLISWKIAWLFRINPPGKKQNKIKNQTQNTLIPNLEFQCLQTEACFPGFQGDLEMLKLLMGIATFQIKCIHSGLPKDKPNLSTEWIISSLQESVHFIYHIRFILK